MNDKNKRSDMAEASAWSGKIDFEEVRKVIALLEEKNLSMFELEVEDFKLKISRCPPPPAAVPVSVIQAGPAAPPVPGAESGPGLPAPAEERDAGLVYVTSPMVGTFYRSPDPTAPPFADVGDTVKKGQTLCIVEAMKLMNEIESEFDGTVVEVLAENAKPVEFGQRLMAIKPAS